LFVAFWLLVAVPLPLLAQEGRDIQPEAELLMQLANQARAAAGRPPLRWDSALAEAALKHTLRMVAEGPIAHQYPGELNVSERAGLAGAHFELIEENVAVASTPPGIHEGWMESKGHRENLLNPDVDSVGIAVVASRGVLYATADYSHRVAALTQAEVESRLSGLIQGVHDGKRHAAIRGHNAADVHPALGDFRPQRTAQATGRATRFAAIS
jgi:hypothetical protein